MWSFEEEVEEQTRSMAREQTRQIEEERKQRSGHEPTQQTSKDQRRRIVHEKTRLIVRGQVKTEVWRVALLDLAFCLDSLAQFLLE